MSAWIVLTEWVSRLVLLLLFGLSIWSVSIMIDRYKLFKIFEKEGALEEARKLIQAKNWRGLQDLLAKNQGLKAELLKAALLTQTAEYEPIDRSVRAFLSDERVKMERGLTTLATLGANAPFIGLFGTVLGIIQAFGALASSQSSTASVMTGISEALIATAVGLFVAIPAVVAYNVFSRKMRVLLSECESLKDYYIAYRSQQTTN